jgi:hypothetical protein
MNYLLPVTVGPIAAEVARAASRIAANRTASDE